MFLSSVRIELPKRRGRRFEKLHLIVPLLIAGALVYFFRSSWTNPIFTAEEGFVYYSSARLVDQNWMPRELVSVTWGPLYQIWFLS